MTPNPEGEYISIVAAAFDYLAQLHTYREDITKEQLEKAVRVFGIMNPEIMDKQRQKWLNKDLQLLIDQHWDVLKNSKNRDRRPELIRGMLR